MTNEEQCPFCFRVKQTLQVFENDRFETRLVCLRCPGRRSLYPYLSQWRTEQMESEKEPWVPAPETATYWRLCQLYKRNPDDFGFKDSSSHSIEQQMDRMFFEEHQRVVVSGDPDDNPPADATFSPTNYEFRRLEHTSTVSVPNHLNPEVISERFEVSLTDAKRLVAAFQRLGFDWKVVWQHCMPHLQLCNNDRDLREKAISYYEELAELLPELEPIPQHDEYRGVSGMNLFYSVY